jgi:hypothetical protein
LRAEFLSAQALEQMAREQQSIERALIFDNHPVCFA